MKTNITLTQSQKASIKEMYHQRPDLSTRDIADFIGLSHKQVFAYMKQLGYTKEKHNKAVMERKAKIEQTRAKEKVLPVMKPVKFDGANDTKYSPLINEKQIEAKLRKQVETAEKAMMEAADEGNLDKFITLRKDYDAAQRRLEAYKTRGTMTAEDKTIYRAINQYGTIN